jgi:DNA-directed RNA polymerase specialized sigma24 family protein
MIRVLARGGNWRQIDSALFLLCQGFSYQEAANLAGICRKTLHNWIRQARQQPQIAPEWLINRATARQRMRA